MSLREQFEKWLMYNYPGTFEHDTDNSREEWEMAWQAFQRGHALGLQETSQPKPYHCTKCGGAGWAQRSTGEVVECDECDSCGL